MSNFTIKNITLTKSKSNNKNYTNLNYTIFISNLNITLNITKQYINNKIKNYLIDDHTLLTNNLYNQLITYINLYDILTNQDNNSNIEKLYEASNQLNEKIVESSNNLINYACRF